MALVIVAILGVVAGCAQLAPTSAPVPTAVPTTVQASATPVPPTDTPAPSATPPPTATATAVPSPTSEPTAVSTPDEVTLTNLQRGYASLVLLDATLAMMDELAAALQADKIESVQAAGVLMGAAMLLGAMDEIMAADAPDTRLAGVWPDAQKAFATGKSVAGQWFNKEITSKEVSDLLASARADLDDAIKRAEKALSKESGVSTAEMKRWREETVATLTDFEALLNPTPAVNQ